jgi:hypothetical protein
MLIKGEGGNMMRTEILEELKKLSVKERLEVIEAALHLLQEDLQVIERPLTPSERKRQLAAAAEALRPDYAEDNELTSFTVLDSQDVHA